jgi:hypothetical protein
LDAVIEVIAHELAPVAVGLEAGHGPEWEAAFGTIHAARTRDMETAERGTAWSKG